MTTTAPAKAKAEKARQAAEKKKELSD